MTFIVRGLPSFGIVNSGVTAMLYPVYVVDVNRKQQRRKPTLQNTLC